VNVRWFEELTGAGVAAAAGHPVRPRTAEGRRPSSRPDAGTGTAPHRSDQRDEAVSRTARTASTMCRRSDA
jgi:hypothetical protein